jgi:hypothetical protein
LLRCGLHGVVLAEKVFNWNSVHSVRCPASSYSVRNIAIIPLLGYYL